MKVIDCYVSLEGFKEVLTFSVEPTLSQEDLASAVNRLRKTVLNLDSEEISILVRGYLQHFQIPLTLKNTQGNINLSYLMSQYETSKVNIETMKCTESEELPSHSHI